MTRIPELEQELVAAAARLRSPRRRLVWPAARAALAVGAAAAVVAVAVVVTAEQDGDQARQPGGSRAVPTTAMAADDREAGVRFALDGRVLTVSLLPSAYRNTSEGVYGRRIQASCDTSFASDRDRPVESTQFWPPGRDRVRFRFGRDISRSARWCRLEHPVVGHVAFVSFGGARPGPPAPSAGPGAARRAERMIERTANEWARLFAASEPAACEYMSQPACERLRCLRVNQTPIPDCTPPSRAYRRSFARLRVEDVVIRGRRAAARFPNGEAVELFWDPDTLGGVWTIERFGANAGRGFFE